jgi:dTDP-4-dehydrorhamnose reductase
VNILITGGNGQLAFDLRAALGGHQITALGRHKLDITVPLQIEAALDRWKPHVLINTAAFHQVDVCESEPEQSFAVNAAAVQRLASACHQRLVTLVHLSTDYVFDGEKSAPYLERDHIRPLSVYGASKAAGEMAIRAATDRYLIVRTTGLYGLAGTKTGRGSFVETMLRLAQRGEPISVVADQTLTPSHTSDVAATIAHLLDRSALGTYHVTNSGSCSWYEFAAEIFRLTNLDVDLIPTTQAERPSPARRPAYSVLSHEKLLQLGLPEIPDWQTALAAYLAARKELSVSD